MIILINEITILKCYAMTPSERIGILSSFNKARRAVNPSASGMILLEYDEDIEAQVQQYLDSQEDCSVWGGYPRYKNGVFNIYRDRAKDSIDVANIRGLNNIKYYDYFTKDCKPGTEGKCNIIAITEILVTDKLARIGCATIPCPISPKKFAHGCAGAYYDKNIFVDPDSENYPWELGESCSKCPPGYNYCNNGLCSKTPVTLKPTTEKPTKRPSFLPTSPTPPTAPTTKSPVTKKPTKAPVTKKPTTRKPTKAPVTKKPTNLPTSPTPPTIKGPPTKKPVVIPTLKPTKAPVTKSPTLPKPTFSPTTQPTFSPWSF